MDMCNMNCIKLLFYCPGKFYNLFFQVIYFHECVRVERDFVVRSVISV